MRNYGFNLVLQKYISECIKEYIILAVIILAQTPTIQHSQF